MKIPSHLSETSIRNMPAFVYRDGMTADKEYVEWLSDVKKSHQLGDQLTMTEKSHQLGDQSD